MTGKRRIVRPGKPGRYSAEDLEHAGDSAREMVAGSKVIQVCLAAMIASRRLYMVARSALDNEVHKGWEVDDPELVIQTLVMSAQEKANEKFKVADLHRACIGTVLPFMDIVLQQSRETGEEPCGDVADPAPEPQGEQNAESSCGSESTG